MRPSSCRASESSRAGSKGRHQTSDRTSIRQTHRGSAVRQAQAPPTGSRQRTDRRYTAAAGGRWSARPPPRPTRTAALADAGAQTRASAGPQTPRHRGTPCAAADR
eukprot:scaffold16761_cov142-Isochrysis_galbana.AAC.4